ncbi:hypothetical protein AX774_g1846 [Zancudomyces culisetae]|uniref:Uncharacterized protein n=1 Tax=Zancudomyces culisetae TaxID=1213189 RepID=A0A1R1PUK1_ZANCU|nr:hypothetical protein AX774_g1846 [Zancudomyces culisetae]|eukprot:OMH84634.1 hypothetical protein AX774_g1846 [Zancudomyces culisetae]
MLVNSVVDLHEYIDIVDVSINMIVYLTNVNVYISKADNRYDEPVSIGQVKIKQLIAQHQQDAFALDFMSSVKTWGRVFYDASNISSSAWKKLKRVTCSCSVSCSDGICRRVGDGWSWELDTLDSE